MSNSQDAFYDAHHRHHHRLHKAPSRCRSGTFRGLSRSELLSLVFVDEVTHHDGLAAVRAHTNRGNTAAGKLLQLLHVLTSVLRQLIQALRIRNVLSPAVKVLKNRLSVVELSLSLGISS